MYITAKEQYEEVRRQPVQLSKWEKTYHTAYLELAKLRLDHQLQAIRHLQTMYYYNTWKNATAIRKDLSQEIRSMNVQVISAEKSGQTSLVIRLAKNEFSNQKSYEDLNTNT